jgi:hypothetical protein
VKKSIRKVATAADENDELKLEYDLRRLRVRKVGAKRKNFGGVIIRSKPDVAEMFPDSKSVSDNCKK